VPDICQAVQKASSFPNLC